MRLIDVNVQSNDFIGIKAVHDHLEIKKYHKAPVPSCKYRKKKRITSFVSHLAIIVDGVSYPRGASTNVP